MPVHALAPKSVLATAVADSSQGVVEKVDGGVSADHMPASFLIPNGSTVECHQIRKGVYSTYCLCHAYDIFAFQRNR